MLANRLLLLSVDLVFGIIRGGQRWSNLYVVNLALLNSISHGHFLLLISLSDLTYLYPPSGILYKLNISKIPFSTAPLSPNMNSAH